MLVCTLIKPITEHSSPFTLIQSNTPRTMLVCTLIKPIAEHSSPFTLILSNTPTTMLVCTLIKPITEHSKPIYPDTIQHSPLVISWRWLYNGTHVIILICFLWLSVTALTYHRLHHHMVDVSNTQPVRVIIREINMG